VRPRWDSDERRLRQQPAAIAVDYTFVAYATNDVEGESTTRRHSHRVTSSEYSVSIRRFRRSAPPIRRPPFRPRDLVPLGPLERGRAHELDSSIRRSVDPAGGAGQTVDSFTWSAGAATNASGPRIATDGATTYWTHEGDLMTVCQ
jgi:hypothetical protein